MARVFNFSAGPAVLPTAVLSEARDELLDWAGTGMSVMEISHRSAAFKRVAEQADADLRALLSIPDNYTVLFLQGGASAQFSMVPLNLTDTGDNVDYIDTGYWSSKAIREARRFCEVRVVASSEKDRYCKIPPIEPDSLNPAASFLHYTPNETIGGVEFHAIPDCGDVPLVADMSSTILSRPLDVSRFGLIYAGAQKNIGPAGLTLVIVRDDLLRDPRPGTPTIFSYAAVAKAGSMLNTPPTFAWYLASRVFAWLRAEGGLAVVGARNQRKAEKLYVQIDESRFYHSPVVPGDRSWMNVPFTLEQPALEARFFEQATNEGLTNLKGHRTVGGMRASLYNAMPEEGVDVLIDFMRDFERRCG